VCAIEISAPVPPGVTSSSKGLASGSTLMPFSAAIFSAMARRNSPVPSAGL
jgi:hypothetical protein